jgi:hypothetical protein
LAWVVLGCTPEAVPAHVEPVVVDEPVVAEPESAPRRLATADCAGTTAIWSGHDPNETEGDYPITYGFETLAFRFDTGPHAGSTLEFVPAGALYFSDWRLDIFSPDCRRVLLLQDRFGPYHVVALDRLHDYLLGRAEPEAVLTGCTGCTSAAVHAEGQWVDADTLAWETGACGTTEFHRVDLPAKPKCRE